jgi:hypothetical protein
LKFFNNLNRKRALKAELQKESRIVSANSMEVLAEYEELLDDYEEAL